MPTIRDVAEFLEALAPPRIAEDWDNVGLLVGDRDAPAHRVMTCLTITPGTAAEAVEHSAELIVAHHPLPFRPLQRLTTDSTAGRLLLELIAARVAVYSAHTAFDSATTGINQQMAEGLGLVNVGPLVPSDDGPGAGRWGRLAPAQSLSELVDRVKRFLSIRAVRGVGASDARIEKVAVACGSAGEFLEPARELGCDCLVTGETRFHTCLEAESRGVALLLTGHYASERFAVERLADELAGQFADAEIWASRCECDPLVWY